MKPKTFNKKLTNECFPSVVRLKFCFAPEYRTALTTVKVFHFMRLNLLFFISHMKYICEKLVCIKFLIQLQNVLTNVIASKQENDFKYKWSTQIFKLQRAIFKGLLKINDMQKQGLNTIEKFLFENTLIL